MELWRPSAARAQNTHLAYFQRSMAARHPERTLASYQDLWRWSTEHPEQFWQEASVALGIKWRHAPATVMTRRGEKTMMGTKWFTSGQLNFAENLLPASDSRVVLSAFEEGSPEPERLTGQQVHEHVASLQTLFKECGLAKGDRVAGVLGNGVAAIIGMLATTATAAIWTSCSPDFGVQAIIDRFGQVEPKIVLLTASYVYGGKRHEPARLLNGLLAALPTVTTVVLVGAVPEGIEPVSANVRVVTWREAVGRKDVGSVHLTATPFDHPAYILYSSGTTGKPKCIVHGAGGTLLQHKKELHWHSDIGADGHLLYFTTCGWMMWNWMVSALSLGARVTLYDGSPLAPDASALWRLVAKENVTAFGLSPRLLAMTMQAGFKPSSLDLTALRTILSTGSPLLPEQAEWVYGSVKKDVHLASISGGTDIVSCFMLGHPGLPVYAGEIQVPGLGMAIDAWDDNAKPIRGERGELVCTQPFPSMPVCFLKDPNDEKYRNAYFSFYADREVWRHGDFVEFTQHDGIIVHGRSDTTLNPGGVRIGTAELYRVVEHMPWVLDCLAISRERVAGEPEIALFVKVKADRPVEWKRELAQHIRKELSPRHVPAGLYDVSDIPYTRSGKKVELAVFEAVHGKEVKNRDAMANPEALDVCVRALRDGEKA